MATEKSLIFVRLCLLLRKESKIILLLPFDGNRFETMSNSRFDRRYWKTILGIFELIVLLCLLLASICALVSSNGWAQQADWVSIICQDYQTNQYVAALSECSENNSPDAYSTFSANSVRTASIVIFLLTFFIVLIIFLVHIFAKLRKRKTWKIVTRIVSFSLMNLFFVDLFFQNNLDRTSVRHSWSTRSIDIDRSDILGN